MFLFGIKKYIPLIVTSGLSALTTGLIVESYNETPKGIYELKTNSSIPTGKPASKEKPEPDEMRDWEFILYELGAPKKDVVISKGLAVEYILTKIYNKVYKVDNAFLEKKVKEKWKDIITKKPHLKNTTEENTKKQSLLAECNATKNNRLDEKFFQKQLNFAVNYCIEEAPETKK